MAAKASNTNAKKTAKDLMAIVNKHVGADTLTMANDPRYVTSTISTGLLPMDILLGGGIPKGRFVECYGDFSTLKSYVGMKTIANVQRSGGTACVIDTEHSFDEDWAQQIGIDINNLLIQRPETGEEAIDTAQVLTAEGVDFILFDSIAATLPQDEADKRLRDEKIQPGRQAALMSIACRRLTSVNKQGTTFFWINQTRQKIGVTFGSNESFPGGRAMQYYASHRVKMVKIGQEKITKKTHTGRGWSNTNEVLAQKYMAQVTKSKLSKPFREILFEWNLRTNSIDLPLFLFAQGLEYGLIKSSGAYYSLPDGTALGQGAQNVLWFFEENPETAYQLEQDLRGIHDLPALPAYKAAPKPRKAVRKAPTAAKKAPTRKRVVKK